MNLSFAGCGFLGIYHVGVAVCFKKYAPHLLLNKISGASAGAIAACCLLCDLPIGEVASDMLGLIREARLRTLGPFSPSFNVQEYLLDRLSKVLPEDAHLRVNGKLHISLTRVYDGKNVIVSQFTGKNDLLQALLASAFVPVFSGFLPPKFHGERYMDGGFSDNLPTLDENTITVSPFCGETDICPRDFSSQLFHVNFANTSIELSKQNIYRFARILWPPKPEVLSNLCKQGFDDALRFLHRNNLINCTRCLAVQSTFIISEAQEECSDYDPQCQECQLHRQGYLSDKMASYGLNTDTEKDKQINAATDKTFEALVANLPDTVMRVFQEAIDSANKGLYNWMLSHRGMKLISLLSLPYTVPLDFTLAALKKIKILLLYMIKNLKVMCSFLVDEMIHSIYSIHSRAGDKISTNVACQFEYSGLGYDDEHLIEKELNFNIKVNMDESDFEKSTKIITSNILSRRSSLALQADSTLVDDTFENILQVTSHHDAVMAFYYMDDDYKVKITEIFDVTENSEVDSTKRNHSYDWEDPSNSLLTSKNDEDHDEMKCLKEDNSITDTSVDEENIENGNIFSDPESEWASSSGIRVRRANSLRHLKPESEQTVTTND